MNSPQTLTTDEADKILNQLLVWSCSYWQKIKGMRNYAIALLMLDAGLRVGEVTQLLISDLWLGNEAVHTLVVSAQIAKNHRERHVPLTSRLRSLIPRLNKHIWYKTDTDSVRFAFFNDVSFRHITTRQVERIIKRAAITAIGRPVHPHVLRHTFASNLMRKTNARVVQELLGHKHLTSTQIYTHPNAKDLKDAIDSLHKPATVDPHAQKGGG